MIKNCILIVLLSLSMLSLATEKKKDIGTENIVKLMLLRDPSIGVERKLGLRDVVELKALMNYSYSYSAWYLFPEIQTGYRYYYNILRREHQEKRSKLNSADFFLCNVGYRFQNILSASDGVVIDHRLLSDPYRISCVCQWGIRRVYHRFSFEF
ncbi:hypothetical protein K4L44_14375 [Halosquirtibacter laminarini]|uniref:Uncharacterized protein n=1 Tax=Halosquirtibacter laminarini TaxID=3374600 RepID=A0AC61NDU2_9BACT|nr:hypothetical protein K4L44_14375 [Prolixibacteraceae bacterium]